MFTDRLSLPIDSQRLSQQDQTLSLSGMEWEDYEQITEENNGYRISYFEGIITIVSPSQSHEVIERIISILINAYCRKYSKLYFPMGSTTLKNPFTVGKEPDTSYAFDTAKPLPDLAVEVVFSSGGTADLIKYRHLGVSEVWFLRMETLLFKKLVPQSRRQNEQIKFYQLVDDRYIEIEFSDCLNNLSSEFLIEFINRGLTESPLTIKTDFIAQLDSN